MIINLRIVNYSERDSMLTFFQIHGITEGINRILSISLLNK